MAPSLFFIVSLLILIKTARRFLFAHYNVTYTFTLAAQGLVNIFLGYLYFGRFIDVCDVFTLIK